MLPAQWVVGAIHELLLPCNPQLNQANQAVGIRSVKMDSPKVGVRK